MNHKKVRIPLHMPSSFHNTCRYRLLKMFQAHIGRKWLNYLHLLLWIWCRLGTTRTFDTVRKNYRVHIFGTENKMKIQHLQCHNRLYYYNFGRLHCPHRMHTSRMGNVGNLTPPQEMRISQTDNCSKYHQ